MASTKYPVIYLTQSSIWIYDTKQKENAVFETDWDGGDLTPSFKKIAKHFGIKTCHIILGQQLVKVAGFEVDPEKLNRETVLSQTQQVLGESVTDQTFDWKVVDQNPETKAPIVQVATTSPALLNNLSYAAKEADISLKLIKPAAVLLAEETSKIPTLHLLLYNKQEAIGVIAFQGVAYFASPLSQSEYESDIEQMLEEAYQKFTFEINNVVIDWHHRSDEKNSSAPQAPEDWHQHEQSLDPFQIISTQNLNSKDANGLSFVPVSVPQTPQPLPKSIIANPKTTKKFPFKPIIATLLVLLLISGLIYGGLSLSKRATTSQQLQPLSTPTPQPTIIPTPTLEPIITSNLKVQILNGSGVPGEAGRVQDLLLTAGFDTGNIETGNAKNYEYAVTEIQAEASMSAQLETLMEDVLGKNYILRYDKDLDTNSQFNLQIIVGQQKPTPIESTTNTDPDLSPTSTP